MDPPRTDAGPGVLTCGVVLQDRVLAEGLEAPGDQDVLEVGGGGVVAAQDDGGEQHGAALRLGHDHLDASHLWGNAQHGGQLLVFIK